MSDFPTINGCKEYSPSSAYIEAILLHNWLAPGLVTRRSLASKRVLTISTHSPMLGLSHLCQSIIGLEDKTLCYLARPFCCS